MKKLGMLGIIGGAALLTVAPFSLQWSQDEVSLSLNSANARIGRSYYGGRVSSYAPSGFSCQLPSYASPPSRESYYLPPFASVSSYNYVCGRGRRARRVQDTNDD
jgi:hypothetical protein